MRSKTFIQTCMQSYDGLMKIPADTFFVSLKKLHAPFSNDHHRQSLEICYFFYRRNYQLSIISVDYFFLEVQRKIIGSQLYMYNQSNGESTTIGFIKKIFTNIKIRLLIM